MVTRLAHSRAAVITGEQNEQNALNPSSDRGWVLLPAIARRQYIKLIDKQPLLLSASEQTPHNSLEGAGTHGVIACGIGYNYVKEVDYMPTIMPIRDLRNTSEISELAHKMQEPIFITKNGYSDLVVMSAELYEKFAQTNRIDQAIFEAEKEVEDGAEPIPAKAVRKRLDEKYHG